MSLNMRESSIAWVAGSIGSPATLAQYKLHNGVETPDVFTYDVASGRTVGRALMVPDKMVGQHFLCRFTTALNGCPETGVPPYWGALARAIGMQESGANFAWTYALPLGVSNSNFLDASVAGYVDPIDLVYGIGGKAITMADCVGSAVFNFTAPGCPTATWDFIGRAASATAYETIAAAAALGTQPEEVAILSSLAPTFTLNIPIVSGTADAGGSGTLLNDAAGDFINRGLQAGMAIENATDASTAIIVSVTATALTTTALSGGGDNTWQSGDTYNAGSALAYSNFTVQGASYAIANNLGTSPGIGGRKGHYRPQLTRGSAGGAFVIKEPSFVRTTTDDAFDFRRFWEQFGGNLSANIATSMVHNSGGSGSGQQLTISWTGLPNQAPRQAATDGSDYAYLAVPFPQHPTSGGFSIVTA